MRLCFGAIPRCNNLTSAGHRRFKQHLLKKASMIGSEHPPVTERYTGGIAPSQTAIICLAVGLAVMVGADVVTPSYARIGVMVLFGAQIRLEQRCARRLFLMSPVFLLALVGLVAFTLLPNAIYAALQPFHDHQPGSNSFWEAPTGPRCSPISVAGGKDGSLRFAPPGWRCTVSSRSSRPPGPYRRSA